MLAPTVRLGSWPISFPVANFAAIGHNWHSGRAEPRIEYGAGLWGETRNPGKSPKSNHSGSTAAFGGR